MPKMLSRISFSLATVLLYYRTKQAYLCLQNYHHCCNSTLMNKNKAKLNYSYFETYSLKLSYFCTKLVIINKIDKLLIN